MTIRSNGVPTRTWDGRETSRGMFLARFPVGSCQNPGSPPSIVLPADGGLQSPCLDSVEVRLDRVGSLTFTSDEIGFCSSTVTLREVVKN